MAGNGGSIWHFNGASYKYYEGFEDDIRINNMDIRDDFVILCGSNYYEMRATIILGTKN